MKPNNNKNHSYYQLYKRLKKQLQSQLNINQRRNANRNRVNANEEHGKSTEINKRRDGVKWTDVAMVLISAFLAYYTFALFKDTSKSTEAATESVEVAKLALQSAKEKDSIENIVRNTTDSIDDIQRERNRVRDSISMGLTRQSSEISEQALNETKKSYEFSRESAVKELRAYQTIVKTNLKNLMKDSIFTLETEIRNVGKTPAYNSVCEVGYVFNTSENNIVLNKGFKRIGPSMGISTVGSTQSTTHTSDSEVTIMQNGLNQLGDRKKYLFMVIEVLYEDIFGEKHFTHGLYRYNFAEKAFNTCNRYNDAN